MKLTAQALAKFRWPDKPDYIVFDDDIAGFGLRSRNGRRSWIFQYAIGAGAGKINRRIKIGDYPALSPGKARAEAEDLHAKLHLHGDPAIERRKNRIDASNTFGRLVERYLAYKKTQVRPRSFVEVSRHLNSNAKSLHNLPLVSIDRAAVARTLDAVARRGASEANRTRASLSAMFVWAMREGLANINPVINTNRREEKTRDRVLSDAELRTIWNALGTNDYAAIVKLLMLTGQRANEIAGLRWSEIDLDRGVITLPAARTKNGYAHEIPIARTMRMILEDRPRTKGLLFGRLEGSPFNGWNNSKLALDKRTGPMKRWVIHDLRRTAATGMATIGVGPHIIEAVLNHVSGHKGGIAGIYNRATYAKEKAEALARWDKHISAVVKEAPSKVVGLWGRR
jgi:integrase